MKNSIYKKKCSITISDSAAIKGGFWIPTGELAVFVVKMREKIINWLTTDHKIKL